MPAERESIEAALRLAKQLSESTPYVWSVFESEGGALFVVYRIGHSGKWTNHLQHKMDLPPIARFHYPLDSHELGADCPRCGGIICSTHDICHDCEWEIVEADRRDAAR
jgi:hypothetical protein